MNSGHGLNADLPANVSGQHDQPSHVPLQYLPKNNLQQKNTMFNINITSLDDEIMFENKDKSVSDCCFPMCCVCLGKLSSSPPFFLSLNKYFGLYL